MNRLSHLYLKDLEARRGEGYYDKAIAAAESTDDVFAYYDADNFQAIKRGQSFPVSPSSKSPNSRWRRTGEVIRRAAHAGRSVAKTTLGIDRASDEQFEARLAVCHRCPGGHATFKKDGGLHTCGPMLKSMADAGQQTCGCILNKKARDLKEDCPFGYWPTIDSSASPPS